MGGRLSGRRLAGLPAGRGRPTTDRTREGVASALEARGAFVGARVLDLYAGTGAYGFEALSRGAASVLAVDSDRRAAAVMQGNAQALGVADVHRVLMCDLCGEPDAVCARLEVQADLVFADPPYAETAGARPLLAEVAARLCAPGAWVVLEHAARDGAPEIAGLAPVARYRYGDAAVVLYRAEEADR